MTATPAPPSSIGRAGVAVAAALPPGELEDGSRGRILLAALELFARRGFFGTSIRDIAAAVGMTSASLYSHFRSKDEILAELLRIGHGHHVTRLRAALADSDESPATRLRAVVRAHVLTHAEYPLVAVVANSELHALPEDAIGDVLALRREAEDIVSGVIEDGVARGEFDVASPYLALAAIGGMGLRVAHWYDATAPVSADELADAYALFALRLVGATTGTH